ncbi:helix-turn-helix domain-containing protein [Chitinophagaceae bacterium LB-8]|uniref:Helix-turn-helix domain-containing protein n=1 Tax=Paraflavisolibacter caeni TaxID=2982496 RepID=A0A9X2XVA2_9BACT|nr:helix-turn-helix domain-containing protein [Paraflavisolibacter caeni]MCU7549964.1 helix-turn-helix domain-containing protein [Paraflavisolibacter caeni]
MADQNSFTLVNEQNGNLAFKLFFFEDNSYFDHLQRNNYYSLIWIKEGAGKLKTGFSEYNFEQNSLFSFAPYQPFLFSSKFIKGVAIYFHSDFFCIHKHQTEVTCNGVLFNNIYDIPFFSVDEHLEATLNGVIEQIKSEIQNPGIAQYELLISFMKIFLIAASRSKSQQQPHTLQLKQVKKEPFILQDLKDAIEKEFKSKHAPRDYAVLLNISLNALTKITKTHFNKNLTNLITERIIIEAKRELYLTNKSVKELAYELGYEDEYYFSRFFKKNASISPQMYRETVGFGKAEIN